jgi:hypothetical protein
MSSLAVLIVALLVFTAFITKHTKITIDRYNFGRSINQYIIDLVRWLKMIVLTQL